MAGLSSCPTLEHVVLGGSSPRKIEKKTVAIIIMHVKTEPYYDA